MLNFAAIVPHPPSIIPGVPKTRLSPAKKTIKALDNLGEELKKFQPETIIIISPHGPMRYDKFTINLRDNYKGSFANFGIQDEESYCFRNDKILSSKLFRKIKSVNIPIDPIIEEEIDYGSLIPLHYMTKSMTKKPRVIMLTFTSQDWKTHFDFGCHIKEILNETDYNVAFIASADLSHRITDDSPAGYSPYGIKFDQTLINLLKKNELEKLLDLNPEFSEEAQECGLRSIMTALGVVNGSGADFVQLSYEHPFGVGYLTGRWKLKK
ncbi:MAG: class III extradiol dioxygenase subunit B-like domain-containing protein [Patescibacteria group bacterium]|nr:class III extradiol dioxygenase subunit B-like domain-containing protein [Patescibacteria group bacterium]